MRRIGTRRYQPMQQDFGILPNGALPAQAATGQPWTNGGTVTNGVFIGAPGPTLHLVTVDPGILTDGISMTLGPPNIIDTIFLYLDWIDANNQTFVCVTQGAPWIIGDTIAGVTTTRGSLADPGEVDGDRISAAWSGQTITVSKNGVALFSGVSQLARGTRIGVQTGPNWGVRTLASGLAVASYP